MGCILFYKNQVQLMLLVITPTTAGKFKFCLSGQLLTGRFCFETLFTCFTDCLLFLNMISMDAVGNNTNNSKV
jgi:hypothetical protein